MALNFVEKPGYKRFMGYLYGWGASLVIIGALFKINHYPGANLMLIIGMGTEAIIFFFSAFEKQHAEYQWDRVYPVLKNKPDGSPLYAEGEVPMPAYASGSKVSSAEQDLLSEKLDEMLAKANVSPAVFERLSNGIEKLTETTRNIGNLPDMVGANKDYAAQLNKMTEQMSALNQFYASQIQMTQAQAEVSAKMQKDISQLTEALSGSLESSIKYRQEIDDLSNKVAALNKMYGQMLSAMQNAQGTTRN